MLIFNLGALISGIIVALLSLLINSMFPAFLNGPYGGLAISCLIIFVGLVVEIAGMKPRFFFIPVGIVGAIATVIQTWVLWKWYSLVVIVLIVVGIILLFRNLMHLSVRRSRERGNIAFNKYLTEADPIQKRMWLLKAFITGGAGIGDRASIQHNLEVLSKILSNYGTLFSVEKKSAIEVYIKDYLKVLEKQQIKFADVKDIKDIDSILESVLK